MAQQPYPDDVLVSRARGGDRAALEVLAGRCRPLIYRWALVQTGDRDEAEDVTQTVLLRLTDRLEGFRGEARFTTWLYQVTRSVVLGLVRRRSRRRRVFEAHRRQFEAETAAPGPAAESLDRQALARLVRAAFDRLPARQREVLDLVDLQGHSAAEASRMLGIEPATARVHLLRARRAVRAEVLATRPALVEDRTE